MESTSGYGQGPYAFYDGGQFLKFAEHPMFKSHPLKLIVGGLTVGAAGLLVFRRLTRPMPKRQAHEVLHTGLAGQVFIAALETGLTAWLSYRDKERKRLSPAAAHSFH